MFYSDADCAFRILGVFHVIREEPRIITVDCKKKSSLVYRIKGDCTFYCEKETLNVSPSDISFLPIGASYRRESEPEELIVVHLQGFGELGRDVEAVKNAAYVEPLFRKLLATWESKDTAAYNRSVSVLYSIFEALQDANEHTSAAPPASIRAGVALLQERYRDPGLRIGDLAKACFVSEVYFRNVFRQHFGKSPKKMLDELRFRHACDLLTSEYYTQAEVARRSGFEDVKFFRTAFKKHMGITPGEYKKGKG